MFRQEGLLSRLCANRDERQLRVAVQLLRRRAAVGHPRAAVTATAVLVPRLTRHVASRFRRLLLLGHTAWSLAQQHQKGRHNHTGRPKWPTFPERTARMYLPSGMPKRFTVLR
jgi:hypothetical protein